MLSEPCGERRLDEAELRPGMYLEAGASEDLYGGVIDAVRVTRPAADHYDVVIARGSEKTRVQFDHLVLFNEGGENLGVAYREGRAVPKNPRVIE